MVLGAGAGGALLLLRGSGDLLLLGRWDEAVVAEVAEVARAAAAVDERSDHASLSGDRWWRPGASSTSALWGH